MLGLTEPDTIQCVREGLGSRLAQFSQLAYGDHCLMLVPEVLGAPGDVGMMYDV